jgi:hypothetical protein
VTFSPLLCHWCSRVEVGARRSVPDHLDQLGRRRSWQRAPAFSFEAVGFYLVHALIVDFRFRSVGSLWVDIRSGIGGGHVSTPMVRDANPSRAPS